MALSSFTVAGYRSFLRPTTIELRPLTLLFGYNNSGKSALLRVLPLLADSVGTPRGTPLNLESQAVRGVPFRELFSQLEPQRQIEFSFKWEVEVFEDDFETFKYHISILNPADTQFRPPIVTSFYYLNSHEERELSGLLPRKHPRGMETC